MAEKRSLFQMWFGNRPENVQSQTQLKMLNGYTPTFTTMSSNLYDFDTVRTAVDTIARHVGKLKPKHVRRVDGTLQMPTSTLENLLSVQPNPHMDAYTFFYKVATQYFMRNNAFILVDKDNMGNVRGFYPLESSRVELLEVQGSVYCKFSFLGGQKLTLPYEDVIHLRRFFYKNDFYGETSENALLPTLSLLQTANDGIVNAVKSSAYLRGLMKFTNILKAEDMKKARNDFVSDYMDITNNGGVAALDSKADYIPLNSEPKMVDAKQMEMIEEKVYKYFNVSKPIVTSEYTEEQFNAFYSSVLEPLAIQMSLEFTRKLFTDRERGFGNEIIFSANRLTFASNQTKIAMARDLLPLGLFTLNEMREVFELEPVEGGDKRIQTLNVVDANLANQYQMGGDTNGNQQG